MSPGPVPADAGRDDAPARYAAEPEGPWWEDDEEALPCGLAPGELAGVREAARDEAAEDAGVAAEMARLGGSLGAIAAMTVRRGPGQPGSARVRAGESCSRAAAFGTGMALDVMPACPELALAADAAAGRDDGYQGASDAELAGVLAAWDRLEAHMAARKLAAAAELIRRRPEPGCVPQGAARMPAACEEFTGDELGRVLAESRGGADALLDLALALETRLPGTRAALRDGVITRYKAEIIASAAVLLDPAEARAAEALVLGRAGRLTPGALRSAIARAVMQVAPAKARKRREAAAKDARVQRWAEDSGNAALMGRELPPAEVLAADQRITAWARELKAAGLAGDMDQLRARAYLDLLLDKDSRPRPEAGQDAPGGQDGAGGGDVPGGDGGGPQDPRGGGGSGPGGPGRPAGPAGPAGGARPGGFAGKVTLTIPAATLLEQAERPGEIPGIGPIDPALARDLADAAAQHPKTTWCVTVTDQDGHAVGHGCARPGPKNRRTRAGPGPPARNGAGNRDGPGFSLTATSQDGPRGGYGTWRLTTPGDGPDLIITLDPVTTQDCDHRFEARGHDPGVKLRHLSQIRHATCTGPVCRRPASQSDFEHNTPYEAGGRTCLCNTGPKCRHDHRLKQHPRWHADQLPDGTFRWTTPSGRSYDTEPTRYPI